MAELTGQTFAGFEVVTKLGQGGMGAVYKARQPLLDRFVALKVMSQQLSGDPTYVARFIREAASAAKLSHPNMVQVHTAGEQGGVYYIVMEFIEGESLSQRLKRVGVLDPVEAIAITLHVATALQCAWNEARLIHRDIKPDNVFLSKKGEVKVGDLGLAKSVTEGATEMTQSGMMMGSPHYMSPEQARASKETDFRTDIYSLGCTLYQLLTGMTPYQADDALGLILKHVNDPAPDLQASMPSCPQVLVALVGKMMAKDRNVRHGSYEELIAELWQVSDIIGQQQAAATAALTPAAASTRTAIKPTVAEVGTIAPTVKQTVAVVAPPPKKQGFKLVHAIAGIGVAVLLLAGLLFWSPWNKPPSQNSITPSLQHSAASAANSAIRNPQSALPGSVFTNSVGAEMVYIPPGEFMLGSTKEEQAWAVANGRKEEEVKREGEAPRKATIKQGFWMGRTEVTIGQWKQFVRDTGYLTDGEKKGESDAPQPGKSVLKKGVSWRNPDFGFEMEDNHPVSCISWNDAKAFCEWMTERERKAGRLPTGMGVRLPTEAEWEYACRAGRQTKWWWGDSKEDGKGRLNWSGKEDGFELVSPVDSYDARGRNRLGLADMLGNVWEWCLDEHDAKQAHEECYSGDPGARVLRGGSFAGTPAYCRCAFRFCSNPSRSNSHYGFRVCYGVDVSGATKTTAASSPAAVANESGILAPAETRIPVLTTNPKVGEVFTLPLGSNVTMELMGIPPGEFMMGSTKEEQAWAVANGASEEQAKRNGEAPRKTTIKQGFWMGRTEVTVGQWKLFVAATGYITNGEENGASDTALGPGQEFGRVKGANWKDPNFGFKLKDNDAVNCISWNDAVAFCEWLNGREQKVGRLPPGFKVRLPTEAEWEYACRAGEQTKFWWGETKEDGDNRLNWKGKRDGFEFVSPVDHYGSRGRNKFGLADMLGNIFELCLDEFDEIQAHEECYKGNLGYRTLRGGSFNAYPGHARCASRTKNAPSYSHSHIGFRVCCSVDVSGATPLTTASTSPAPYGVDDAFIKEVTTLPAEEQFQRVMAKIKELNPGFHGKSEYQTEKGQVTGLSISDVMMADISPVRALRQLHGFICGFSGGGHSRLADLSPLQGLPLKRLVCSRTQVENLEPLKGMPLNDLNCAWAQVKDLSPLQDLPLISLRCNDNRELADLSPLKRSVLKNLVCNRTKVTDLSPIRKVLLESLSCDFVPSRDTEILRSMVTLKTINDLPVAEFWKRVEAGETPQAK